MFVCFKRIPILSYSQFSSCFKLNPPFKFLSVIFSVMIEVCFPIKMRKFYSFIYLRKIMSFIDYTERYLYKEKEILVTKTLLILNFWNLKHQISNFKVQISNLVFRLQISDFEFQTSESKSEIWNLLIWSFRFIFGFAYDIIQFGKNG